jgi:DNA-binding XRE family transcriptional regulator
MSHTAGRVCYTSAGSLRFRLPHALRLDPMEKNIVTAFPPNNLRECREHRQLTAREVATALDVSRSTLSRWETGQSPIPQNKLLDLSDLFGVSTDYLLGRFQLAVRRNAA